MINFIKQIAQQLDIMFIGIIIEVISYAVIQFIEDLKKKYIKKIY